MNERLIVLGLALQWGTDLTFAGLEGENRLDVEVNPAALVEEDVEHRLQVVLRGLVADQDRDMGQGMEDQGDIGPVPLDGPALEEIDDVAE